MKRKGVHNVPEFSSKRGPKPKNETPQAEQQKQASQKTAPPVPKPHSTSMKSGRRGS
jgi:hypothetical protein